MQQLVQKVPPPGLSTMVPAARDSGRQPPGLGVWGGGACRGSPHAMSVFRVSWTEFAYFLFKRMGEKRVFKNPNVSFSSKKKE